MSSAREAFQFLRINDFSSFLSSGPTTEPAGWIEEEVLSEVVSCENGLQYHVSRLRDRMLGDSFARGKCYQLIGMSSAAQEEAKELLLRHARICRRVEAHPHIAVCRGVFPSQDGTVHWVLDQWTAGKTLADFCRAGPMLPDLVRSAMTQVALALKALHEADVIVRTLCPDSIYLRDKDQSAVLTDFEFGKLLGNRPTVRPKNGFPDAPFLAPEVQTAVDRRADVYSWGRVFLFATLGGAPETNKEKFAKAPKGIPPAVWKMVVKCCAPLPSSRPAHTDMLLETLEKWK